MTEQNDRIPPHLRGLVLGGIRSGRLGDVLGRFSGYVSIGTELARKLWLSLAYPILSIFAAVALFLFVNASSWRSSRRSFETSACRCPR